MDTMNDALIQRAVEVIRIKELELTSPTIATNPETKVQYYNMSRGIVNALDKRFSSSGPEVCRTSVDVIILVPSRPGSCSLRRAIRATYGRMSKDKVARINSFNIKKIVRVVFLLGKTSNVSETEIVERESSTFQDIVEIDFIDSYYNLTTKVLHGLKWIRMNCPDVDFVVKADEDVFINIIELIRQLHKFSNEGSEYVLGTVQREKRNTKVIREGRWGVSYDEMPLAYYPPYAQGNCYVISGSLVPKIVETAPYFPYLPIEDAFITGVLAGKLHGARLVHLKRNAKWLWLDVVPDTCRFVRYRYISMSNMAPENMYTIWNSLLHKNFTTCHSDKH